MKKKYVGKCNNCECVLNQLKINLGDTDVFYEFLGVMAINMKRAGKLVN